jgi:hypothetical protein
MKVAGNKMDLMEKESTNFLMEAAIKANGKEEKKKEKVSSSTVMGIFMMVNFQKD